MDRMEFFTWQATANICGAQFNWAGFCCKTQIDKQTYKKIKKTFCTFTYTDWQVSTGTYTDDLTAEESLWHQSNADLRSSPKYTIDVISIILSLGASMLAELWPPQVELLWLLDDEHKFYDFLYTSD